MSQPGRVDPGTGRPAAVNAAQADLVQPPDPSTCLPADSVVSGPAGRRRQSNTLRLLSPEPI